VIKTLLEEKELMLKEVHHRIKNNMNTIYGLLILQAGTVKEVSAKTALEEAGNRVQSMMLLYEKIYSATDYREISVALHLPALIDEILANFPDSESVKVEKFIENFVLEIRYLLPLGIILNELLTNIMKYAFTGHENVIITISVSRENGQVTLVVGDNGNGIPESIDFENTTGFGLR
jgi:two-component sensor histidine kinase